MPYIIKPPKTHGSPVTSISTWAWQQLSDLLKTLLSPVKGSSIPIIIRHNQLYFMRDTIIKTQLKITAVKTLSMDCHPTTNTGRADKKISYLAVSQSSVGRRFATRARSRGLAANAPTTSVIVLLQYQLRL